MSIFSQKVSCKIRMRSRPGAEKGYLFQQIIIDGEPKRYPLGITWPVNKFDKDSEELLPRFRDDEKSYQLNMVIKAEKARADKLILKYYVSEKSASHDAFEKALRLYSAREDIVKYFRVQSTLLKEAKIVDEGTIKHYNTAFNRVDNYLKDKKTRWQFNNITYEELLSFESWIRSKWSHNTLCGQMRILHKFFGIAHEEGMMIHDPFDKYKMPAYVDGVRDIMEISDIKQLRAYFDDPNNKLTPHEADVVRRYLVCCFTGLRKSDVEQLDPRFHIRNGNVLRLHMFKTRRYGKSVEFSLSQSAVQLIGVKRALLFPAMESALLGKTLRKALKKASIFKYLKFCSSRDSFATAYLTLGGNIRDLQEILGHSSIKTTEIYLKMTSHTKSDIMSKFDNM